MPIHADWLLLIYGVLRFDGHVMNGDVIREDRAQVKSEMRRAAVRDRRQGE
jgi:hypothetical protein